MQILDPHLLKASGRKYFVALLASSALFTAGCAMQTTASDIDTFGSPAAVLSGSVHGGNQPVFGATVTLYTVGQTGQGSSGTTLATTTTSATGGFSFVQTATPANSPATMATALGGNTYECGNTVDDLLYVVARGGNTTGSGSTTVNNSAAVFIAPVGNCSTAAAVRVNVTEVTTAAMVASTGNFLNPNTEEIGADGIGVAFVAINHAFQTVANLVSQSTGFALTTRTLTNAATTNYSGGPFYVSQVAVTVTPEAAKLNTVANILSSCINQASYTTTNCSTLFADAVPPAANHTAQPTVTFPTATDTLQAALYMFLNPSDSTTANRTALFNLSAATPPFQPTLTAVPTDWSIAILYSSTSTCDNPSADSTFISSPNGLAVDGNGNIWFSNDQSNHAALSEISSTGVPASCLEFGNPIATGTHTNTTIDDAGNVWFGDTQFDSLVRFTPNGGTILHYNTATPPLAITADGSDNVFFTGAISGTGRLFKLLGAARATNTGSAIEIANTLAVTPTSAFPDNSGDIWVASGSNFITEVVQTAGGTENGYTPTNFTVATPSKSIAVGPTNTIYALSGDPADTITAFIPSGNTFARKTGFPVAANLGGTNNPISIYLDGAQSTWIDNASAETSTLQYAASVIGVDGLGISAAGSSNGGYQKSSTYFNAMRNIVIDLGGNVWITNDGIANGITEIVGAAAPIYQPYAYGITQGRFQSVP